jgi:hypothetical protein
MACGSACSLAPRNPAARNGIFGCRDRRPRIHPRDRNCRQRPGTLKIGGKIPAETETASLESPTKCVVCEDWMVVEAVTREPVSNANSLLTGKNTGNFAI